MEHFVAINGAEITSFNGWFRVAWDEFMRSWSAIRREHQFLSDDGTLHTIALPEERWRHLQTENEREAWAFIGRVIQEGPPKDSPYYPDEDGYDLTCHDEECASA